MFWQTTRDATMYTSIQCISRHEKTQVYGTILLKELTNQAMSKSITYKTYYTFASGEKNPKPKIKTKAKVTKSNKNKQTTKKPIAKGLDVFFEVALTEAEQLKLDTKRSKKDFHISHASGSGDGVDTQLKVHNEQQQKTFGTDKGTGIIPGVPDVLIYDSKSGSEDHDDDSDDEKTESDRDEILDPNLTNVDQTEHEEENIDEIIHTSLDYELTNDEKIHDEENIDEEEEDEVTKELYDNSGFEQEEEDAHVTLTPVLDIQKTGGLTQSSSVSSDFTRKLLNLDNPSPTNNEITSLMNTIAYHATEIPKITSSFTTPTLPPLPFFNPILEEAQDEKREYIELVDSMSSYEAATTLFEFELTRILIDKIEKNKSFDVADYKREIYDALVKSYNTDKDIFESYGEENKSSSTSKDASQSQHKSSRKSAHVEEPSHNVKDLGMQQDQEFITGDNDEQLADKEVTKPDWFKKPKRPPTLNPDSSKRQYVDFRLPQTWISQITHAEEPPTSFDELNDTSFDFSVFVMNRL
uniref:Uncharacterized protein n=1 Tax=Tanacetum cinerariifolium TaxID=118510 RepID=A0A6L2MKQ3_TANCI|nr:hypothetical protein [Tanacetum cinerariifolium]